MYDTVIIGKGPAGISSAIYLSRALKSVLVISNGTGDLGKASLIENYYGFDKISGSELSQKGIKQAKHFGADFADGEVVAIERGEHFSVKTASESFEAKTVLLATGKSKTPLKTEGFEKYIGYGISTCAVCDGFLYRDKHIALIGCGNYAAHELSFLLRFTKDITVFTNGEKDISKDIPSDIKINNEHITKFNGDTKFKSIATENGEYEFDAAFAAIGTANASSFAKTLGIIEKDGHISVDENFSTNIKGIFAAGDCIGGLYQVVKAASDGALAAMSILKFLK